MTYDNIRNKSTDLLLESETITVHKQFVSIKKAKNIIFIIVRIWIKWNLMCKDTFKCNIWRWIINVRVKLKKES